jgi:hypothetical protein
MDIEFISYVNPELLVLIPVLNLVGVAIKRSNADDSVIPLALGILGMTLATLYGLATRDGGSVAMVLFGGIVQGILCAAAAVYAHQVLKQGGVIA